MPGSCGLITMDDKTKVGNSIEFPTGLVGNCRKFKPMGCITGGADAHK
jgi:uncharacterized protein YkvS